MAGPNIRLRARGEARVPAKALREWGGFYKLNVACVRPRGSASEEGRSPVDLGHWGTREGASRNRVVPASLPGAGVECPVDLVMAWNPSGKWNSSFSARRF